MVGNIQVFRERIVDVLTQLRNEIGGIKDYCPGEMFCKKNPRNGVVFRVELSGMLPHIVYLLVTSSKLTPETEEEYSSCPVISVVIRPEEKQEGIKSKIRTAIQNFREKRNSGD